MLLRIFLVTVALVAGMAALKDGRVLTRSGLVATCTAVSAPEGGTGAWQACRPGRLEGRPDLTRKSCVSQGVSGGIEYWRCAERIQSGPMA